MGWKELHDSLRKTGHVSKYSGDKWAPRAQNLVWQYVLGHWIHRNGIVNGAKEDEERQIERHLLEQQVREVYHKRPPIGKQRKLFH